jgi:hypothetical protein
MSIDRNGVLHIAWTCLYCLFINCWNWEDGSPLGPQIEMTCDNCERVTQMVLKKVR